MCLAGQFWALAGRRTRGRNNPHVAGIDVLLFWSNRTGRFRAKALDSSEEALAHRASRNRVDRCVVQASLTLPTSRTAADAMQPTSQIRAGQGNETIAPGTVGARNAEESADPIGAESCSSSGASTLVIGAGRLECNDDGMSKLHKGRRMIAQNATAHTR